MNNINDIEARISTLNGMLLDGYNKNIIENDGAEFSEQQKLERENIRKEISELEQLLQILKEEEELKSISEEHLNIEND